MLSVSSSTIVSTPPDHRVAGGGHAHRENCVHLYPGGRRFGRVPSSPSDGPGFHLAERSSASPSDGQRGCGRGVSLRDHGAVKVAPPSVTNLPAQAGVWARGHGSNAMPGTCNRPHAATTALSAGRSTACSTATASTASERARRRAALVPDCTDVSSYSDEQAAGMGLSRSSASAAHERTDPPPPPPSLLASSSARSTAAAKFDVTSTRYVHALREKRERLGVGGRQLNGHYVSSQCMAYSHRCMHRSSCTRMCSH